jgi:hypothetical protein
VHRDLKPANVLLGKGGEVKISDFGVAKMLEDTCGQMDSQIGTARYMSPERARGDPFSHASDIWSMGLVVGESAQHRHMLPPTHGFYEIFLLVAEGAPPEGPEEPPAPLAATDEMLNKYDALPEEVEAPKGPLTEKEKKKEALAKKKADLEAKKASRKKGGKKAAPAGPAAAGLRAGDAAAAEMAMEAALQAATGPAAAPAAGPTPEELAAMTPKEKKKAELAAKKATLEQKKLDRAAGKGGKKGKKGAVAPAQAAPPPVADAAPAAAPPSIEIGRSSCRERVY